MSERLMRSLPKILSIVLLANLMTLLGCGGSAGVDNGTIVGKVFSNLRGGSATRTGEAGVSVMLRDGGNLGIQRTTVTDSNGNYVFPEVPVGTWNLGFAKDGFEPVPVGTGSTGARTTIGNTIDVRIFNGDTVQAPDITLRALQPAGDATVVVKVVDKLTGTPITNAQVIVGPASTTDNVNGVYTLTIPLVNSEGRPFGIPFFFDVRAKAEGFVETDSKGNGAGTEEILFAGQTRSLILEMQPLSTTAQGAARFNGTYRFAQNEPQNLVDLIRNIDLTVKDAGITGTVKSQDGTWTIDGLPPSTPVISRQFDFVFSHPDIETFTLARQVIPQTGGQKTVTQPVLLKAILTTVVGDVRVGPDLTTQRTPASGSVTIVETGQRVSLTGGTYSIPNVPVRQAATDGNYTLLIEALDPEANIFRCNNVTIKPVSDGTSSSAFFVPLVVVTGTCTGGGGPTP